MKIIQGLKKALLPLLKDRGFANMMIICGLICLVMEILVLSITGYSCFYLPGEFINLVNMLKEHWLEHITTLAASIVLVVFGMHIRRKTSWKKGTK